MRVELSLECSKCLERRTQRRFRRAVIECRLQLANLRLQRWAMDKRQGQKLTEVLSAIGLLATAHDFSNEFMRPFAKLVS